MDDPVRQNHLPKVSPEDQLDSILDSRPFRPVLHEQLSGHRIPEADRSLNDLREEANEQSRLPEALLCPYISVIDINEVPRGLKCIERNPDRNQKGQWRIVPAKEMSSRAKKIRHILKEGKQTEIDQKNDPEDSSLLPRECLAQCPFLLVGELPAADRCSVLL